jgi:hypothetical protein
MTTCGDFDSNGSGGLMRCFPAALFIKIEDCLWAAYFQAKCTHKGRDQAICCLLHVYLCHGLINDQ